MSEYAYPGLNAPLIGTASKAHKKAWAQPEFVPQAVIEAARSASHTRQKQFFSYRHDERALAMAALAAGARNKKSAAAAAAPAKSTPAPAAAAAAPPQLVQPSSTAGR